MKKAKSIRETTQLALEHYKSVNLQQRDKSTLQYGTSGASQASDEYVEIAVKLANNIQGLQYLHKT